MKLITEVLEKTPPTPSALRKEIPAELSRITLRCLTKVRDARFQSYADLRDALLPFCAAESVPARPARRFIAGIIDDLFAYGPSFLFLTYWNFDPLDYFVRERTAIAALVWVIFYSWYFIYFGVCEGIWGAAIGKSICGLRVINRSGHAPGIPRGLLRVALYVLPTMIPSLLYMAFVSQADMRASLAQGNELITDWLWWPPFLLLFVTMRSRNGYAAIHDLLSGTRVIVRPRMEVRPRLERLAGTLALPTEGHSSIGPYEVRSALWKMDREELLSGFDPALRRSVWIHLRPLNSPPISATRRDLSRSGRLRWLNGGQTESARWEAFEALDGIALLNKERSHMPWSSVRFVLLDLAKEIAAGIDEPETTPTLSLDRIWLTAGGRALLLDFTCPAVKVRTDALPVDTTNSQLFLRDVATSALSTAAPPPPDAGAFLSALERSAFDKVEFIVGNLAHLTAKPAEITRSWRAASLLFLPACFALLGIFVAGLLTFERIRWERAWSSRYPGRASFLNAAQVYLAHAEEEKESKKSSDDAQLARAYLITHFSDVITNQAFWSSVELRSSLGQSEEKMIKQAFVSPRPDEKILAEADRVVPRWIKKEETRERRIPIGVCLGTLLLGCLCLALVDLAGSAFFRRSPALNLFGIAVLDRTGKIATRCRLLWRWTVAWLPIAVLLFAALALLELKGTTALIASLMSVFGPAVALLAIGIIYHAIRHPARGLADCLAGTWLTPK